MTIHGLQRVDTEEVEKYIAEMEAEYTKEELDALAEEAGEGLRMVEMMGEYWQVQQDLLRKVEEDSGWEALKGVLRWFGWFMGVGPRVSQKEYVSGMPAGWRRALRRVHPLGGVISKELVHKDKERCLRRPFRPTKALVEQESKEVGRGISTVSMALKRTVVRCLCGTLVASSALDCRCSSTLLVWYEREMASLIGDTAARRYGGFDSWVIPRNKYS
jgi:hypothetical protein